MVDNDLLQIYLCTVWSRWVARLKSLFETHTHIDRYSSIMYKICYVNRKSVSQTVLQVRRWRLSSASNAQPLPPSLGPVHSNIISLSHSPRRRPQPLISDGSCRQQRLRSSRRALSGLLRSSSLLTTDYGWLDDDDESAPRPRFNVSRSLSHLRPPSSHLRTAPEYNGLLHSRQSRRALELIQEPAEQTVELEISDRKPHRISDATILKSAAAGVELDKENVRPRSYCSSSGLTTMSQVNKSSSVARHQSSSMPTTSGSSLTLNRSVRAKEDGDRLELGDVTSEWSSCRRALIPASCTVPAGDDVVVDAGMKRTVQKPAEFQRGLTRRSFSLPRIKAKFPLKVVVGNVHIIIKFNTSVHGIVRCANILLFSTIKTRAIMSK